MRLCEAADSSVRDSARSSTASDRNSASVAESCISEVSSVTDFSPDQPTSRSYQVAMIGLTSLALSHCPSAFTVWLYSPSFFALRVSNSSES